MNRIFRWILKHPWTTVACISGLTIFFGIMLKNLYVQNRFLDWLPHTDRVIAGFIEASHTFHSNELVMVAFRARQGETFSTPVLKAVQKLTHELEQRPEISHVLSITTMAHIEKLPDGIEVRDFIETVPEDARELEKLKHLALNDEKIVGQVLSKDGTWLALGIYLSPDVDQDKTFQSIILPLTNKILGNKVDIFFAGETVDTYYANIYSQKDLRTLMPMALVAIALILFLSFRTPGGVFYPLVVVMLATIWVMGTMAILHKPVTLITPIIPVLLIALGSAYGIHVYNRFQYDRQFGGDWTTILLKSMGDIWLPVVLAGVTTIVGFFSFVTARLQLIVDFGIFGGIGLFFAVVISLIFIPALASKLGVKSSRKHTEDGFLERGLMALARTVLKKPGLVLIITGILFLAGLSGIPRIIRRVSFSEYFPPNSPPRQGIHIIHTHLGGANPVGLLFKGNNLLTPAKLRVLRLAENFIASLPETASPFTVADLVEELNEKLNGRYHIPVSDRGIRSLWLFVEGRKEIDQLITPTHDATILMSKVGDLDTLQMNRLYHQIEEFVESFLRRPWVVKDLSGMTWTEALPHREQEARVLTQEMGWILKRYDILPGGFGEIQFLLLRQLKKGLPGPDHPLYAQALSEMLASYIASDEFDFFIDNETADKLIQTLSKHFQTGTPLAETIQTMLKQSIPPDEYDDETAQAVTTTLLYRWNELKKNLWIQDTWNLFLKTLFQQKDPSPPLRKRFTGLLYELIDEIAVYPEHTGTEKGQKLFSDVSPSGMSAVIARLDHFLYVSQLQSLALAFIVTFILMLIFRRSFLLALISVSPIALTVVVIYGCVGYLRIPLDYATMMIASISIGVGIDYAIHLVHGIFVALGQGHVKDKAILLAVKERGRAILANSLAITLGFLLLLFSSMTPLRHFGATMAGSMLVAGFSALTVVPALLFMFYRKGGSQ